jgi:endonuclease III
VLEMNKQKLALEITARLKLRYPRLQTALNWKNPWQLLVATVLSAQCTDKQVNKITPVFFQKWPTPFDLVNSSLEEVAQVVRSAGFYRNKSKNLIAAARIIVSRFNGQVPDRMEDLLALPGVARKTANIILSNAFGINQGIAVDTHVKRISFRLGLSDSTNPDVIEKDLTVLFPVEEWGDVNHLLVFFGREVCKARRPECARCELNDICVKKGI